MFEIVFFGTSASAPSIHRGLSSAAIIAGEDRFLIDCGEGTQRQILRSGIGFKRLNRILLTHAHLDHILGLGGLVSTFTRWEKMDEIFIYGGQQTIDRVRILVDDVVMAGMPPPIPIHYEIVAPDVIYRGRDYSVTAFPVMHRGRGCFGYLFQENDHRPFNAEKATALGIPHGPQRGQLVRGENVTLPDGTVVTPEMVLGETVQGMKIVFTGDIGNLEAIRPIIANADVLVTEATFLDDQREEANQFGHITAKQAAQMASEMGVRYLLLTHISRRYREYDVIKEAQAVFPNTYVVRDLDHFAIRRGQPIEKVEKTPEA